MTQPSALETLNIREFLNQTETVRVAEGVYVFGGDSETSEINATLDYAWKIAKAAVGLQVRGHLEGKLNLTCDWCHQPFSRPIALVVEETYVIAAYANVLPPDNVSGKEKELQATDFYEVVDENDDLDLKDLANQYLVIDCSGPNRCGDPDCHPD